MLARGRASLALDAPAVEPVCVVGPLATLSGIGEGGRLAGRGFAALGYDVRSVDVSELLAGSPSTPPQPPLLERGPGTVILHFNPDNLALALAMLDRGRLRGKRIIGYWAWELLRIPDRWLPALDEVDEVWTPSRFVADAVRPFTSKPIHVVPHPVALAPVGTARRADFDMGDAFTVLIMFSFVSCPRKNPVAAVRAFRRAFGDAGDRLLIVKCVDADQRPEEIEKLRDAIGGATNIRIDERRLGDDERLDLVASADVFLSLHHSEGFGLGMAEAMLAGVPVIATAWSGNLDYMDESSALLVPFRLIEAIDPHRVYGSDQVWADADVAAAADHLTALAADPAAFEPMRRRARAKAQDLLGLAAFSRAIAGLAPLAAREEAPARPPGAAIPMSRSLL